MKIDESRFKHKNGKYRGSWTSRHVIAFVYAERALGRKIGKFIRHKISAAGLVVPLDGSPPIGMGEALYSLDVPDKK